ncbi:hypothetical protein TIFTF001_013551 [Ficus carica]|uniref:Rhodanese domain-containing protein n=1 Tax=Ficus carica TaxID=3494 RepID=A0AA88A4J9_FICCA|nr:hypothetical protein TIFTF001_013551 [Ficus carica]
MPIFLFSTYKLPTLLTLDVAFETLSTKPLFFPVDASIVWINKAETVARIRSAGPDNPERSDETGKETRPSLGFFFLFSWRDKLKKTGRSRGNYCSRKGVRNRPFIKPEKHPTLQVRSVDAKEALRLQKENNFVILDVRPVAEFKEAHPPGAINVQIYRLIKEWTAWDIARRAAFAFFGIFAGTEENPEFIPTVESKISKDAKIIVACATGGTMKPTQNLPEGQQSRSLIAAYLLVLNGYTNVFHLEGGLYAWFKEGLPAITEDED